MILKLLALLNGTLGIGFVTAIVGIGSWSLLISYMILTLGYGVKEAVATSLVCTIITSSSAAPHLPQEETHEPKDGVAVELSTAVGAILGAYPTLHHG